MSLLNVVALVDAKAAALERGGVQPVEAFKGALEAEQEAGRLQGLGALFWEAAAAIARTPDKAGRLPTPVEALRLALQHEIDCGRIHGPA